MTCQRGCCRHCHSEPRCDEECPVGGLRRMYKLLFRWEILNYFWEKECGNWENRYVWREESPASNLIKIVPAHPCKKIEWGLLILLWAIQFHRCLTYGNAPYHSLGYFNYLAILTPVNKWFTCVFQWHTVQIPKQLPYIFVSRLKIFFLTGASQLITSSETILH